MRLYRYVGSDGIAASRGAAPQGVVIRAADDVRSWALNTKQDLSQGCVIATFVVDEDGWLRIADRRSEHVVCAGGGRVRAAGEMTFGIARSVTVLSASNQSTGYCPEPESWPAVVAALTRAGLDAPSGFDLACVFRRCPECQILAIVKLARFECEVCGAPLPISYNVQ